MKAAAAALLLLVTAPPAAPSVAGREQAPPGCPAHSLRIAPGASLSDAVERAPAGATFCIEAGLHRLQSARPKDGQRFFGEPGAILSGAAIVTGFRRSQGAWVAAGPRLPAPARGLCAAGHEACGQPEIVFVDGEPLRQVATRSLLAPGTFFHDRERRLLLLADSPDGRLVEVATARHALFGPANGVEIHGLTVEKYANPAQEGAVRGEGAGWRIMNSEFRLNSGAGVSVGSASIVAGCRIHHNGQIGATADGADILFEDNAIWANNRHGFDPGWDAGGIKVTDSRKVVFRGNDVHHNDGPGLWCDERCVDVTFEGNRIAHNRSAGIFFELSSKAVIRHNRLSLNNEAGAAWYWGAEIQIAASEDAHVHDNLLVVRAGGRGVMLIDQNRWKAGGGFYQTRGNRVVGNDITFLGDGFAGGVSVAEPDAANFGIIERGGNLFDRNLYRARLRLHPPRFVWGTSEIGFEEFRRLGQEGAGRLVDLGASR